MTRAIIDVDGTLWDLHEVLLPILHERRREIPIEIPKSWDFYAPYMTDKEFYQCVDEAHAKQGDYEPFDGARDLFKLFYDYNIEVIVASHRNSKFLEELTYWLHSRELRPIAGVYTGYAKKELFRYGDIVIDDSPTTMRFAISMGCKSLAIRWPWNVEIPGSLLFGDLPEMVRWLKVELGATEDA